VGARPLWAVLCLFLAGRAAAASMSPHAPVMPLAPARSAPVDLFLRHDSLAYPLPGGERVAAATLDRPSSAPAPTEDSSAHSVAPSARLFWTSFISLGSIGGAAYSSFTDHPTGGWHVTDEDSSGKQLRRRIRQGVPLRVLLHHRARDELPLRVSRVHPVAVAVDGFGLSSATG